MIEILTALTGLLVGQHQIDLEVHPPVAMIEIYLDGRPVQTIHAPPWTTLVDLGEALQPHHLEAIGRDLNGFEIDRSSRWLNYAPRLESATQVVVSAPEATANWSRPPDHLLQVDGQPVPTAFRPPSDGLVLVVADAAARSALRSLSLLFVTDEYQNQFGDSRWIEAWPPQEFRLDDDSVISAGLEVYRSNRDRSQPPTPEAIVQHQLEWTLNALRGRHRFTSPTKTRFISPFAGAPTTLDRQRNIFLTSTPGEVALASLLWQGVRCRPARPASRLADAVGLAGIEASSHPGPRAVLLLLADDQADASFYDPIRVENLLETLHVPLFVWALRDVEAARNWRAAQDLSAAQFEDLPQSRLEAHDRAFEHLDRHLRSQRALEVTGTHLPQQIRVSPSAETYRLAGSARRHEDG